MGRAPCCDKANVKKGPWSPEEDTKLKEYIEKYGTGGNWIALPQKAGLRRCGKSCRLRWLNYLRPNIKHGEFSDAEDRIICNLFASIGSRWSIIAAQLPGRTDNDIKNYWNTKLKKKLMGQMGPAFQKKPNNPHFSTSHFSSTSTCFQPSLSLFHQTNSSSSTLLSSPYSSCSRSFTSYEANMSIPSSPNTLFSNQQQQQPITPLLQSQETYVGPMHNYQSKDNNTLLTFGDHSGSCSPSEVKGVDFQYGGMPSGVYVYDFDDQNVGLSFSCKGDDGNLEKEQGYFGKSSLDCSLDEIKQLISTNLCSNNLNFFVDENKEEEKVMYY